MSVQAQQYSTEEGLPAGPPQRARLPPGMPGLIADVAGRSGVPPRLSRGAPQLDGRGFLRRRVKESWN